ncbi:MAG: tetratricopeptide repeat protein [Deltaproteobacteria bacterium]|nr:tetratricopeptide repeat protein [Deltaproteobacteria bacterium]
MTDTAKKQYQISCSEVTSYWDAQISEDYTNEKAEAVSKHLTECEDCQNFVKLVSSLNKLPDDFEKFELNNSLNNVLKINQERRQLRKLRFYQWSAAAAAVVICAVVTVFLMFFLPSSKDRTMMLQCKASEPNEIVEGVFLSYCNNDEPGVLIKDGGDVKVSLRSGTIGLFVNPNRVHKHNVSIDAPHGQVFVKGTIFTVQVSLQDTRVEVFRGIVEFKPVNSSATFHVSLGNGAELAAGKIFSVTTPRTDVLRRKLLELASTFELNSINTVNKNQSSDKAITSNTGALGKSNNPDHLQTPAVPSRSNKNSNGNNSHESIYTLTKKAQSCLIKQDWECAVSNYKKVLDAYPHNPESMTVFISLAKIELRFLNKPREALSHYQKYIKKVENGPLAEEAYFGIAESFRKLGNKNEEIQSLSQFIKLYPESSLIPKAQNRMNQLKQ